MFGIKLVCGCHNCEVTLALGFIFQALYFAFILPGTFRPRVSCDVKLMRIKKTCLSYFSIYVYSFYCNSFIRNIRMIRENLVENQPRIIFMHSKLES